MIFSVYDHAERCYRYYEGPGVTPPHGWHRPATPGTLRQPEEMAAKLPDDVTFCGSGALPRGVIATDLPGIGTVDTEKPQSGRATGLAAVAMPAHDADAWESADSRGNIVTRHGR